MAGLLLPAAPASAAAGRVSQGDAEAVLNAYGGGGALVTYGQPPVKVAAPADVDQRATIRPLSFEYDQRHYCALDWHVIVVGLFFAVDATFTKADAQAFADATTLTLVLDGAVLSTTRTPLKAWPAAAVVFGFDGGYYFQEGIVVSPGDLAAGAHVLSLTAKGPEAFQDQITFHVDPAGTGVCD